MEHWGDVILLQNLDCRDLLLNDLESFRTLERCAANAELEIHYKGDTPECLRAAWYIGLLCSIFPGGGASQMIWCRVKLSRVIYPASQLSEFASRVLNFPHVVCNPRPFNVYDVDINQMWVQIVEGV